MTWLSVTMRMASSINLRNLRAERLSPRGLQSPDQRADQGGHKAHATSAK